MNLEDSHAAPTTFPESKLAHQLLDGLQGLEIGPGAHNPFGLVTRNVGLSADRDEVDYEFYKQSQIERCGTFASIDIAADAANIPVPESSTDFVVHSHVWEHLPNCLSALVEWVRITKPDGFMFIIVPKRDAAPSDQSRPLTPLSALIALHENERRRRTPAVWEPGSGRGHYTVFSPGLLREIARWFNRAQTRAWLEEVAFQETDDKVGNGHTIVWRVRKYSALTGFARARLRRVGLLGGAD